MTDKISRGETAKRILDDKLFKEAISSIKDEIVRLLEDSPNRDKEGREWLCMYLKASNQFVNTLTTYMNDGKMAIAQRETKGNVINDVLKRFVA